MTLCSLSCSLSRLRTANRQFAKTPNPKMTDQPSFRDSGVSTFEDVVPAKAWSAGVSPRQGLYSSLDSMRERKLRRDTVFEHYDSRAGGTHPAFPALLFCSPAPRQRLHTTAALPGYSLRLSLRCVMRWRGLFFLFDAVARELAV
jgi:hypothetical protein